MGCIPCSLPVQAFGSSLVQPRLGRLSRTAQKSRNCLKHVIQALWGHFPAVLGRRCDPPSECGPHLSPPLSRPSILGASRAVAQANLQAVETGDRPQPAHSSINPLGRNMGRKKGADNSTLDDNSICLAPVLAARSIFEVPTRSTGSLDLRDRLCGEFRNPAHGISSEPEP